MRRVATLVAVVAALVVPASAAASTTIGQVFTPTAQTTATLAQTAVSTGTGYTVPTDGVITSWSFQSDDSPAQLKLKVLRANPDGTYVVVGESALVTGTANQAATFSTRIPVKAGDVIGTAALPAQAGGQPGKSVAYTGANGDTVVLAAGDQPPGSSTNYSNVQGIRVDATATIEPDADADGYGDETQDLCPTDPAVQGKCLADLKISVTPNLRTVHPGDQVIFTVDVHNSGPSIARDLDVRADLSSELALVGTSWMQCSGGASMSCNLGDVANGADSTFKIVARALTTGVGSVAARAISDTDDPNAGNNAAGGFAFVTWKRGSCKNLDSDGSTGRDILTGTSAGDLINGLDGNDVIAALSGNDCVNGGPGKDRITGGDGRDLLNGDSGNDVLSGGSGGDVIDGGTGNDRINGGSGRDKLNGGPGRDRINAVDGWRDTVDCGSGRDVAHVDRGDRVRHCERVSRAQKHRRRR